MGYTVHLEQGTEVRTAPSSGCGAEGKLPSGSPVVVNAVQSDTDSRHIKAIKARLNIERADISLTQKVELLEMLAGFHNVFSLSEGYSPTKKEVIEMDATETAVFQHLMQQVLAGLKLNLLKNSDSFLWWRIAIVTFVI
eukprot:Em0022g827a